MDDSGLDTDTQETGDSSPDSAGDTALADVDGDGWSVEDGDCDDADPLAYPGALERCDGRDQDCDGEPIGPGDCAEGIDFADHTALAGWIGSRDYALAGIIGVSSGGAGQDLIFGQSYAWDSPSDGTVQALAVFRDMPAGAMRPYPEGAADVLYPTWPYTYVQPSLPFVDHDGDARRDLVLASPATLSSAGAIFLFDEPGDEPRIGSYETLRKAVWLAPSDDLDFASSVDAHADLDGDGSAEIVALTSGYWSGEQLDSSTIYLLPGRVGVAGELDPRDEIVLSGEGTGIGWQSWTSSIHGLPDLDGDGAAELLLHGGIGGSAIGSGQTLMTADGANLSAVFDEVAVPDDIEPIVDYGSPGDWDGDGIGDLAWVERGGAEVENCVSIASYSAPFARDVLTETLQQICYPDATLSLLRADRDLDEDGLLDPILNLCGRGLAGDGVTCASYIVPTSWLDGGTIEATQVGIRVIGDPVRGAGLLMADLDEDGLPEFVSSTLEAPTSGYDLPGLVQVLPGFAIPFDDPSRW